MRLLYPDPRVTGPYEPGSKSEDEEHLRRCENGGYTSTDPGLRKGCPACRRRVGWPP